MNYYMILDEKTIQVGTLSTSRLSMKEGNLRMNCLTRKYYYGIRTLLSEVSGRVAVH